MKNQGENVIWSLKKGESPLIATAIHDGHDLRDEVAAIMRLSDEERLREEDPYTSSWVDVAETRIVALRSRFEFDLNRPPEKAVYVTPEDCWGLDVWKERPSDEIIKRSLAEYESYYSLIKKLFTETQEKFGKFVVFDIHSYNHRRHGADTIHEPVEENPEVNIGTGTMNREKWSPLVDRFIEDLRSFDFMGRRLDVRENVKFKGGFQAKWTHENFPETGCVLAIEFKKFWMDEWTGEKDEKKIEAIHKALSSTVPGVLEELKKL
ncbi:MAG TPA: N-formylglutamate amidohydrolase [Pyrinomonadaceae bacterium]|nr:N-formylglutamate amidohydrolase [Pyrinomonadaceae bacterium]